MDVNLHPDARRFLELTSGSPELHERTPSENREAHEATRHLMGEGAAIRTVENMEIGGVPVRVYVPETTPSPSPAFVFFHGGGWVLGDLESADSTVRDIAATSGICCISVHYRRAPEHPFPAALEDARTVTKALLDGQAGLPVDPHKVAVGGDSAGGNLAAVLAQELRDQLAHQVLIYPVMNLASLNTDSHRRYEDGFFLTGSRLSYFYDSYAGESDRTDPCLSPGVTTNLRGLPSATVITAEHDPLIDEVDQYAQAMQDAGVTVTNVMFRGQVHPFINMGALIGDAGAARRMIGAELKSALGT